MASTLAWSSSSAAPRGSRNRARARNNVSPVIGALVHSVSSSSTFTPLAAKRLRHLAHDPRPIGPDQLEREQPTFRALDLASALDQDGESLIGLERAQRALERRGRVLVHLDAQDAGELTGEARHAALQPVAAVAGDQRRHRLDQAGTVRSEQGEHQGSSHASAPQRIDCSTRDLTRRPRRMGSLPAAPAGDHLWEVPCHFPSNSCGACRRPICTSTSTARCASRP